MRSYPSLWIPITVASLRLYKSLASLQFLNMSEHLHFLWMILHLNPQKHSVKISVWNWWFLIWCIDNFANFSSSFLPHFSHCFMHLFLLALYISQRIKSRLAIGCRDCYINIFQLWDQLRREQVCTWVGTDYRLSQFFTPSPLHCGPGSMLHGTLRRFVPPGGISLKETYQGSGFHCAGYHLRHFLSA
jgi:hypothetical protein